MARKTPYQPARSHSEDLEAAVRPLLELFSVVDDVFTEADAFNADKRRQGYGRIYRAWKKTRKDFGVTDDTEAGQAPGEEPVHPDGR